MFQSHNVAGKRTQRSQLISTRGPRDGECNICGIFGPLTEDHTPPKSCRGITAAEMHALYVRVGAGKPPVRGRQFRTGPSFRTLCARCNNVLLGTIYDPALAHFCAEVRRATNTKLQLPDEFRLSIQPQLVMRSVMGHLAAMGIGRYRKGAITETFRDYMLDVSLPLPAEIRFYYWLYPYRPQVIIRDAVKCNIRNHVQSLFWLMKFFPLAFLVSFNEPDVRSWQPLNLDVYRNVPHDSWWPVAVRLRPVVHPYWPESPSDDDFILYGEQAVVINPLTKIMRT
jgi:hypothetical protein